MSTHSLYAWVREQRKVLAARQADANQNGGNAAIAGGVASGHGGARNPKKAAAYFAKG